LGVGRLADLECAGGRGRHWRDPCFCLVALELGGARNDARNLWPEPGATPNPKDSLEARLHARVCDGEMSLSAAQLPIARDWAAAYKRFIGPEPTAP